MHERQRVIQEKRPVFRDDAVHDDDADHRINIDCVVHQKQEEQRADEAEWQREHADERRFGRFVEDGENHVDQNHPHQERREKLDCALPHPVGLPGETIAHRLRQLHFLQIRRDFFEHRRERPRADIRANRDGALFVRAMNRDGPELIGKRRDIGEPHRAVLRLQRHRGQIRFLVILAPGEIHVDVRVVSVIFHVVWQDARARAGERRGKRLVQGLHRDAVMAKFLAVGDERELRQAFLVRRADVRQPIGARFQLFPHGLRGADELVHLVSAKL